MKDFDFKIKKQEEKIAKLTLIEQKQLRLYVNLFGIAMCILIITEGILEYYYFDSVLLNIISLLMSYLILFRSSVLYYFVKKVLLKIFFTKNRL